MESQDTHYFFCSVSLEVPRSRSAGYTHLVVVLPRDTLRLRPRGQGTAGHRPLR